MDSEKMSFRLIWSKLMPEQENEVGQERPTAEKEKEKGKGKTKENGQVEKKEKRRICGARLTLGKEVDPVC